MKLRPHFVAQSSTSNHRSFLQNALQVFVGRWRFAGFPCASTTMYRAPWRCIGALAVMVSALLLSEVLHAQTDETILSGSTCQSGNLTVRKRDPHDGRLVFAFNGSAAGIPVGVDKTNFRTVEQINQYFGTFASDELGAINAICSATTLYSELISFLRNTSGGQATFSVTPEAGGSIVLADGTALTVQAGAVSQPVVITVQTQGTLNQLDIGSASSIQLFPEGLLLAVPATLRIPYVLSPTADASRLRANIFSTANPVQSAGDEIDIAQPAEITGIDTAQNLLSVSLTHFSLVKTFFLQEVEVVLHVPPRFLKPGDMLFHLTSGGRWEPGHVALFVRSSDPDDLTQSTILEAIPKFQDVANSCPSILGNSFGRGVFEEPIAQPFPLQTDAYFLQPDHIYMGAHRPAQTTLTPAMRNGIIGFAESIWKSPTEQCYVPIGRALPGNTWWACTSLVVGSYLQAGVTEFLQFQSPIPALPYTLFESTVPIHEITLGVGESTNIPVSVVAEDLGLPLNSYTENPPGSSLSMSPLSAFAGFDPVTRTVNLTPTSAQACSSNSFKLTATGPMGGGNSVDLIVNVHDFTFSQEAPLGNTSATQPQIGVQITSACNTPLTSATMKLDGIVVASFNDTSGTITTTNLTFVPGTALALGLHTVNIDAVDGDGAHKTESFNFTVTTPPPPSASLVSDACLNTTTGLFTATFSVTGDIGTNVFASGGNGNGISLTLSSCGTWTTSGQFSCTRASNQPDSTLVVVTGDFEVGIQVLTPDGQFLQAAAPLNFPISPDSCPIP